VAQESTKDEPKLSYLPGLHQVITIMHLMITCINTVLIPLAASNITTRRDMETKTNLAINRMEDKVNSIMQRTVDTVLAWVTKLLSQQKRYEFRPRDDVLEDGSAWLEMLQTPTCLSVYTFLSRLHKLTESALPPGSNQTTFLTEVAIGLRTLLLDHFKKFQVNATGALMVTKDMTRYNELLRSWPLDPTFTTSLEVLSEIGNLFVIGPEALKERLRGGGGGGVLAGVGKGDIRPYLLRREDAGSVGIQSVLNAL